MLSKIYHLAIFVTSHSIPLFISPVERSFTSKIKKLNSTNLINYQKRSREREEESELELKQKSITASFRLPIPITSTGSELLVTEAACNSLREHTRKNAAEETFPLRGREKWQRPYTPP